LLSPAWFRLPPPMVTIFVLVFICFFCLC
jgi:hypothetical protein